MTISINASMLSSLKTFIIIDKKHKFLLNCGRTTSSICIVFILLLMVPIQLQSSLPQFLTPSCNDEFHKECHCGSIAIPPSTSLFTRIAYPNSTIIVEEYDEEIPYGYKYLRVYYKCSDERDVLVGNNMRECSKGNWIGMVPRCAVNNLNQTKLSYMKISDYKPMPIDRPFSSKNGQEPLEDKPINVLIYYDESLHLDPNGAFQVPLNNQPHDCLRWSLSPRQIWTMNLAQKTRVHYVRLKLYGNHIEDLYLNHEISIELSLKNVTISGPNDLDKSDNQTNNPISKEPSLDQLPFEIRCRETIPKESQFSTYHQKYSANYLVLDFLCEIEQQEKSLFEFIFTEDYQVDELFASLIEVRFEILNILHLDHSGTNGEHPTGWNQFQTMDLEFKQKIFVISLCELQLYSFNSDCGMPDIPVTAIVQRDFNYIEDSGRHERKSYKYICIDKNQEMKGKPNIECGHYGKWKTEFPKCDPSLPCGLLKNLTFAPGYLVDVKYETTTMNKFKDAVIPNGRFAKIFCIRLGDNVINHDHSNQTMTTLLEAAGDGSNSTSTMTTTIIPEDISSNETPQRDITRVQCRNGRWQGLDQIKCIIPSLDSSPEITPFTNNADGTNQNSTTNVNKIQVVSLPVRVIKILFALFIFLLLIIICLLIYMVIFRKRMTNQQMAHAKGINSVDTMAQYGYPLNNFLGIPTINFEYPNSSSEPYLATYSSVDDFYERITLAEMHRDSHSQNHVYHTIANGRIRKNSLTTNRNGGHYSDLSIYGQSSRKHSKSSINNYPLFNHNRGEERYNSIYGLDEEVGAILDQNKPRRFSDQQHSKNKLNNYSIDDNSASSSMAIMANINNNDNIVNNEQYNTLSRSSSGYLRKNSIYE